MWVPDSSYHHMIFYGQVPPLARVATVRIMTIFLGEDKPYPLSFAFDDVSFRLYHATQRKDEKTKKKPAFFICIRTIRTPSESERLLITLFIQTRESL